MNKDQKVMNNERTLTLMYFVLGIAVGISSIYMSAASAAGLAFGVYVVSLFAVKSTMKIGKRFRWIVINSLVTFILVWLVVWFALFNLD